MQVANLSPHPDNDYLFLPLERRELEEQVRRLAAGERFPPLLVDQENRILAGEEIWRAARELGWLEISVLQAPSLPPSSRRALMVAENIRARQVREHHLARGMNNFFDMQPLRPAGGW